MPTHRKNLSAYLDHAGPARLLRLAYLKTIRELDRRNAKAVTVNLALQGGGALGAFTWGVLDRLSSERRLRIGAISGASAGALNAAVFASGHVNGGGASARRALKSFWTEVSNAAAFASFVFSPMLFGAQATLIERAFGDTARFSVNPLQDILARHVDIDALKTPDAPRLYISATNVLTGKPRIFANADLSIDVLLASACLPNIHPTVWIDDAPYWDGGFSANPPVAPLLDNEADNILLVRLIRAGADAAPQGAGDIDVYIKNMLFDRPLEEELKRISVAARASVGEINLRDYAPDAHLASQPSRRLAASLYEKGREAAERYAAAAGKSAASASAAHAEAKTGSACSRPAAAAHARSWLTAPYRRRATGPRF